MRLLLALLSMPLVASSAYANDIDALWRNSGLACLAGGEPELQSVPNGAALGISNNLSTCLILPDRKNEVLTFHGEKRF